MKDSKSLPLLEKMPKYDKMVRKIVCLVIFFIVLVSVLPWRQTAVGNGQVIAYSPNERQQEISAPIMGRLGAWYVNEGTQVKKGDPIVRIMDNDPDLLSRLKLKEQALRLSLATSQQAEKTAAVNVARQQSLFKVGASSQRKLEQAKLSHMAYVKEAANAKVALAQLQVALSRQQNQLIRSPMQGTILRRMAGQSSVMVAVGDVLATLIPDTQARAAELFIDGNDIPFVRKGDEVRLQFEGWPALQIGGWSSVAVGAFSGKVVNIDAASNGAGQFRILVVPQNREDWPAANYLRQGVRVSAWVLLDKVFLGYEMWRRFNGFPVMREEAV